MKAFIRILLIGSLATTAYAEQPAQTTEPTKTTDTKKDTAKKEKKLTAKELQVMAHYKAVNQTEIDLGKTAQKNAGTQAVKSYAEMLVTDHTDSNKKLKELAKATGQTIPAEKFATEAEKAQHAEMKKSVAAVKKLKGADFDREYLRMMVEGHDNELAMIDAKMAEVQNPALLDMLSAKKTVLQHHADQARELQKTNAQAMRQPTQTK